MVNVFGKNKLNTLLFWGTELLFNIKCQTYFFLNNGLLFLIFLFYNIVLYFYYVLAILVNFERKLYNSFKSIYSVKFMSIVL